MMKDDSNSCDVIMNLNVKQFIREVSKRPSLYNNKLTEYGCRTDVDKHWNDIADIFGVSSDHCKAKWKKLRSCYSRCINRRLRRKSGDPTRSYYLSKDLTFLKEFVGRRGCSPPVNDDDDQSLCVDVANNPSPISHDQNLKRTDSILRSKLEAPRIDKMVSIPSPTVNSNRIALPDKSPSAVKIETVSDDCETDFMELENESLADERNSLQNVYGSLKLKHPMEHFFVSLLPRIISMSDERQSEFQMGVLRLVHTLKYSKDVNEDST